MTERAKAFDIDPSAALCFFATMHLGQKETMSNQASEPTLKVDMRKAGWGKAQTQPLHSGGSGRQSILCKVVAFFVNEDAHGFEYHNRSEPTLPSQFSGPECFLLVRRMPEELFGGLYIVSSTSLESTPYDLEAEEKGLREQAPQTLDVFFQGRGVEREQSGAKEAAPLILKADTTAPPIFVQPIVAPAKKAPRAAGSSSASAADASSPNTTIVVDWTRDEDWKDRGAHHDPLQVSQQLEELRLVDNQATGAREQQWQPVQDRELIKRWNVKSEGVKDKGFVFNEPGTGARNAMQLLPGQYRLRYTLPALRASSGGQSQTSARRRGPGAEVVVYLFLTVEPALPVNFRVECDNTRSDKALPLGEKGQLLLSFIGADNEEVHRRQSSALHTLSCHALASTDPYQRPMRPLVSG